MGNCDTTLFLGGMEKPTLKEILELLGKETIDSVSQAENRCDQVPYNLKQAILFDTGCVVRMAIQNFSKNPVISTVSGLVG